MGSKIIDGPQQKIERAVTLVSTGSGPHAAEESLSTTTVGHNAKSASFHSIS